MDIGEKRKRDIARGKSAGVDIRRGVEGVYMSTRGVDIDEKGKKGVSVGRYYSGGTRGSY